MFKLLILTYFLSVDGGWGGSSVVLAHHTLSYYHQQTSL